MQPSPDNPYRLARSEDIPRAVEKLINWLIRLAFYGLALLMGTIFVVAIVREWSWGVRIVFGVLAISAGCCGRLFGAPCPLVFIPPEVSKPRSPGGEDSTPPGR